MQGVGRCLPRFEVPGLQSWSSVFGSSEPVPIQALFDALGQFPIGIAICDRRLHFVRVNRKLAEINKIPIDDHPDKFIPDIVGKLGSVVEGRLTRVFRTGLPLYNAELVGQLGANPENGHWIENCFPIRDGRNRVTQVGVFVLSVSGLRHRRDGSAGGMVQASDPAGDPGTNAWQSQRKSLSPRETDVLRLLASGRCMKDAATNLGISVRTAETYKAKLMVKTGAQSVADLIHYAIRNEVVTLR